MKGNSNKDFSVYEFQLEDEAVESLSGNISRKFCMRENPRADKYPLTKYSFLEFFSQASNSKHTKITDTLYIDLDSSDDHHTSKCRKIHDPVISEETHEEIPKMKSSSEHDSKPSQKFPADFLNEGTNRKCLCLTSNEQDQSDIMLPIIQKSYTNSQSCSSSELSESEGDLENPISYPISNDHESVDVNMMVVICPDYTVWGDVVYTNSLLTFGSKFIRLQGSHADSLKYSLKYEWPITDVIHIECHWSQNVEIASVKLRLKPTHMEAFDDRIFDSGVAKVMFAVCDSEWFKKEHHIRSLDDRYEALWNALDPELASKDDDFMGQNTMFYIRDCLLNFEEPFEDVVYPKDDPDAVLISKRDIDLLQPEMFINDTIIDFYIKYLGEKLQPERRNRFHFFNSFFFRKLAYLDRDPGSCLQGKTDFQNVRKWTRKIDVFGKDYIFIPVNFNFHWSLIVICHPGEVARFNDEANTALKVPCILHMDSLKGSHKGLKNLVQSYLSEEWKERHKDSSENVLSKFSQLRFVSLELPQQENLYDCGLFLLHYVELFLEEAPVNFNPFKITNYSNFLSTEWFVPSEASFKRSYIKKLVYELCSRSKGISQVSIGTEYIPTSENVLNAMKFVPKHHSPTEKTLSDSLCVVDERMEVELLSPSHMASFHHNEKLELNSQDLLDAVSLGVINTKGNYEIQKVSSSQDSTRMMSSMMEDKEISKRLAFSISGKANSPSPDRFLEETSTTSCSEQIFETPFIKNSIPFGKGEYHESGPSGSGNSSQDRVRFPSPRYLKDFMFSTRDEPEDLEDGSSPSSSSGLGNCIMEDPEEDEAISSDEKIISYAAHQHPHSPTRENLLINDRQPCKKIYNPMPVSDQKTSKRQRL